MKNKKTSVTKRIFMLLISLGFLGLISGIALVSAALLYFGKDLPDYTTLADYEPSIVTRAYASDGRLLAEFATEKRVFIPINTVPKRLIHAFISAEDKNFYTHPGIDFYSIARSVVLNFKNMGTGRRPVGASTITQQVARNFFLSNELSYIRKIKEAIMAFRLEQAFTKDEIMELYLNEIYFGKRSYGVAAAALIYFDRPLNDLSIQEMAYLAALPKAPNNYDPIKNYDAAVGRRNWVIDKMRDNSYITSVEASAAKLMPLEMHKRDSDQYVNFPYFAEEVRRKLMNKYGEEGLYKGGLIAKTTLVPEYQKIAEKALRNGLITYDKRQGLNSKPITKIETTTNWHELLLDVKEPKGAGRFEVGVVLRSNDKAAIIGLKNGKQGLITYNKAKWAMEASRVDSILNEGDVWLVEPSGEMLNKLPVYWLRQIPKIQGAIIVMDPHTGRVFAMAGGFSYDLSQFNRANQAVRQPGSAFKPFVYLTAMEQGFTPATLVMDAPMVYDQGPGLDKWRPKNYNDDFLGPTPLRIGIEKSRNLMTIRLASYIGMDKVVDTASRFDVITNMRPLLSMSVGAGETTLMRMVNAYSSFVNGGKKVSPRFIDRIQDRDGKTIFVHDRIDCINCGPLIAWEGQKTPVIADTREQIADPRHLYQVLSMMEGAVKRGTGISMSSLGRPIAGKTGTTNESKDTWFIGLTPDMIVGAYVGFDEPKPMGDKETGSRVALPIVKEFMGNALKDVSPLPFRMPKGIRLVEVNARTGARAKLGDERKVLDAFLFGNEPGKESTMFNGVDIGPVSDFNNAGEGAETGLGGIY